MSEQLQLNLADQINRSYAESVTLADIAQTHINAALEKVIECGQLLKQQKDSLKHGGWIEWLRANCPDIHERTAQRYMKLANTTHVSFLQDASTVRQAYIAAGIMPEPEKPQPKEITPETPTITFVRPLDRFRLWYNRRTMETPLPEWTPQMKRILRNELRWFAQRYFEMGGNLTELVEEHQAEPDADIE